MKNPASLLKGENIKPVVSTGENNIVYDTQNWYRERYNSIILQRNILLAIALLGIGAIIIGVSVIDKISASRTINPFIVEVGEKTGIVSVVNQATVRQLTANEALNTYFLIMYLRARETYNATDYQYNYGTIVRLLSTTNLYNQFKKFINDNPKSPIKLYNNLISTTLKIRSIQFLQNNKAQIRFTIIENSEGGAHYYRIATINFDYVNINLSQEERYVNPLGFQITSYRADDETL